MQGRTQSGRPPSSAGRWSLALRRALTPAEWRRLAAMYGLIAALHVVGWGMLALLVAPRYPAIGIGTGFLAYQFGLRHAFDADHISAIDNTTRKLMAEGKRPLSVGFFFSLGHSTVVLAIAVGLAFAAGTLASQVGAGGSALRSTGGLVGTAVAGGFLYLIAVLNLIVLVGIVRLFQEMRTGRYDEAQLEAQLLSRGLMARVLGPLARAIRSSWQMYPIGVLFGLGFDTASEVALLAISAGVAANGLPLYAVVCLPVLFAAGMSAMDTADGAFMSKAYGWAFSRPVRRVYYNLTVTGLSVAVAFLVGTIELLQIAVDRLGLSGGAWSLVGGFDLSVVGYVIVGAFVLTWIAAYAVWRWGRVEERWSMRAPPPEQVA